MCIRLFDLYCTSFSLEIRSLLRGGPGQHVYMMDLCFDIRTAGPRTDSRLAHSAPADCGRSYVFASLVFRCVKATEPEQEAVGVQKPKTSLQQLQQICKNPEKVCDASPPPRKVVPGRCCLY